jgi:thioredoxin reductase (NADPH)
MSKIIVIGDGPAGLSAALFLAKNGQNVIVFGLDKTSMHYAMLYNYLGIPEITGSDFLKVAREQVQKFGAEIRAEEVSTIEPGGTGFTVTTANGKNYESQYLILAEGKGLKLAKSLGLSTTSAGVEVDRNYRTSVAGLYVIGRSAGIQRSQAIISAGSGAVAALDILSTEKGKDFNDFDSLEK